MELDKCIETALKGVLKNPVLELLREIVIATVLKQSNFIKRDVGFVPYQVLLHFIYMLLMHKRHPLLSGRAVKLTARMCITGL